MPRVSDQYRADRRAEILAAAAGLFAANGFHATSMADIIGAAGLSAGAVYNYFSSKEELIVAVAGEGLSAADGMFANLLADGAVPPPGQVLAMMVRTIDEQVVHHPVLEVDVTRIAVQVWGEAQRNPRLAAMANTVYRRLRDNFAEVVRRWQAAGHAPADAVPEDVGTVMLSLVQGFILQRLLLSDGDGDGDGTGTGDGTAGGRDDAASYLAGLTALMSSVAPAEVREPGGS